jgi:predicted nuclease of predicted toxin-antitoxin system
MTFVADESVAVAIIDRLRAEGHTLEAIRDTARGSSDDVVLARANQLQAILLTEDKDFGEMVYRLGAVHPGVVLIRLGGVPRDQRVDLVAQVVRDHEAELPGAFTVISRGGVRIRRATPPQSGNP